VGNFWYFRMVVSLGNGLRMRGMVQHGTEGCGTPIRYVYSWNRARKAISVLYGSVEDGGFRCICGLFECFGSHDDWIEELGVGRMRWRRKEVLLLESIARLPLHFPHISSIYSGIL